MGRVHVLTRYLIDSHVLLWAINDDPKLPAAYREILSERNWCFVSIAAIWEMSIKEGLGKLDVPPNLLEIIKGSGLKLLDISPVHAREVRNLPAHHRDSFDRMIITQALVDRFEVMTTDPIFAKYGLRIA